MMKNPVKEGLWLLEYPYAVMGRW